MTKNQATKLQADILIVDDTPNNLRLLGQILGKQYKVRLAPSGQIALTAARSTPPDIILLDIMMPEMNGYEVAGQLKAGQETKEIPIIFISALDDPDSKVRAFAAGGVDYITKPIQEKEVLARVETHLSLRSLYKQAQAEIAERKRAEAALRESELHYRALVEGIPGIVYSFSNKHGGVYYSPHVVGILGYSLEKLYAEPMLWHDSIHPDDLPRVDQTIHDAEAGKAFRLEYRIIDAHGNWHWFDDRSIGYMINGNEVVIGGLALDITESRRVEEALRTSEELLSLFLHYSPIYTYIKEVTPVESRVLKASENFQEMIGIPGSKMVGKTMDELFPAELAEKFTADDWAVVSRGEVLKLDEDLNGRNYTTIKFPIAQGNKTLLAGYTIDITDRKRADENIRQLSRAVEASPTSIVITDVDGNIQYVNPKFTQITGYSFSEVIGKNPRILQSGQTLPEVYTELWGTIPKGKEWHGEFCNRKKNGDLFWESASISPIMNETGTVTHYVAVKEDITERKWTEEALRESEEKYHKIFNNEIDAICIFDIETKRILDVNNAYLKLYGYTRDEVLKLTTDDISAEPEKTNAAIQKARVTGDVVIPERVHRKKDGTVFPVELSAGAYSWKGRNVMFAVARDITKRKQAEAALRASNARLEVLFQVSPLAITLLDSAGNVQLWNTAAEKIFGWPAQEVIGHPNPIVPASKQTEYIAWSAETQRGKSFTNQETIRQRKDGSLLDVSISSAPVYESSGKVNGRMAILADITERKQAVDNLHRMSTLMNMIVENIPNMIFLKDARELRFVRFNRAGEDLLGYSRDDLLGKNDYDFFPKEQADFFTKKDREVLCGNEVVDIPEEPLQTRNKGMRTLHTKKVPLRDANGEPEYLLGISEDITERKQAEESLLRRNHEMATLYETSLEINVLSDVSALLLAIIRRACELLKIPSGALYLMRLEEEALEMVVQHQLPLHWVGAKIHPGEGLAGKVVQTKKPMVVEDYLSWGGRLEAFSDSPARRVLGVPLKTHDQITGVIVLVDKQVGTFSEDEIRLASLFADQAAVAVANAQFAAQLEERVSQRTSELEAANRELESLSYNIAHDMRSPVRAMVGYADILEKTHRTQLDNDGVQLLENIRSSGLRLGQLIDGFLEFLRLGHVAINLQPVNMNDLVNKLLHTLKSEQENRQIEVSLGNLPECQADQKLLVQVWTQLISNALKFTRPREVARIEIGSGEADGKPYYFVRDNGVGFDMKYTNKLFGVFQKLHHESEFEGTGIGLAIARRIIQGHGGKVWAEAEADKGATFYFTLAD